MVKQSTLDAIAARYRWPTVDLLKIDVEGAELLVFRGATKFLSSRPRPVLMCEFSDRRTIAFSYQAKLIYDWLADLGYRWFGLLGEGRLTAQLPKEVYDYENLIACPEEKLGHLSAWTR